MPVLLRNATADGPGRVIDWPGGAGTFWVDGTAAGANVTLETNVAFHGPTRWRPTGDPNLTAVAGEATVNFLLGRCQLRAVLAGATATTDLSVTITCLEGGW
jgi:hypothetical protein